MTQPIPETTPEFDRTREYGPFATLLEAVQSMQADGEAPEPETLEEAEAEIGIADYGPDTGEH